MKFLDILDKIACILLIIGGINWGLIGLFDFNLVAAIFQLPGLISIIYILVGLSAIYKLFRCVHHCRSCEVCHHSRLDESTKFDDTTKPQI